MSPADVDDEAEPERIDANVDLKTLDLSRDKQNVILTFTFATILQAKSFYKLLNTQVQAEGKVSVDMGRPPNTIVDKTRLH